MTGSDLGITACRLCRATVNIATVDASCPCCDATVPGQSASTLARSGALIATAALLYLPANLLPVTHTTTIFGSQDDTILSGVLGLLHSGSWPLALLVFMASIVIPMLKLVSMGYLIATVYVGSIRHTRQRSQLFRLLEFVGRWSMLDIFVVSLLITLVQVDSLASIKVGWGALSFGGVVIITMIAVQTFDERLLWQPLSQGNSHGR